MINRNTFKYAITGIFITFLFFALLEGVIRLGSWTYLKFRNFQQEDLRKKNSFRTVLAIGDSFTFGLHVDKKDSYPLQLQSLLIESGYRDIHVTNMGLPGLSPNGIRTYIGKWINAYKPDLIILLVGFNVNDGDIITYKKVVGTDPEEPISRLNRMRIYLLKSRLFRILDHMIKRMLQKDFGPAVGREIKREMNLFNFYGYQKVNYWALMNLSRMIKETDTELLLMNYPQAPLPDNPFTDNEYYYYIYTPKKNLYTLTDKDYLFPRGDLGETAINLIIRNISDQEQIPLIDNVQVFSKLENKADYFIDNDEHPNVKGYSILALNAFETLSKVGFLKR
jgi:lysophospholipase L1-like esterase